MSSLEGRVALVTGASRGIGYHCALALARAGAHTICVARTVGGLEELDDAINAEGGTATLVPMDLLDFEAINRLGLSIHERWGKLDVLVGNAGLLGGLSPLEHIDSKTFEKVMNLNVTANWRLICSLSPLLRQSDAGRAVFLTSGAAYKCKPFWGLYSTSKAALDALIRTWAAECENTPMRINLLSPGAMRTAMRAEAMPGEDPDDLPHPSEIADCLLALSSPELTQNGLIFDFTSNAFLKPGLPQPI